MILLRKVRRDRWDRPDWVSRAGAPLHCILDFLHFLPDRKLPETKISLFRVGTDRKWEERVVAALGSNGNSVGVVDYVVFPESLLATAGVPWEGTLGDTPDGMVNEDLHIDAGHLEALPVATLATLVHTGWYDDEESAVELCRVTKKEAKQLIARFLDSGDLDEGRIDLGVLKKVELYRA